jgi:hypothetical protein
MKHYLFCEKNTGEEFIVGANDVITAKIMAMEIAWDIAMNYCEEADLGYYGEITEEEAEASGLDEY